MKTTAQIAILLLFVPATEHAGTVLSAGKDRLVIETADGQQHAFVVTAETEIKRNNQDVDLQHIQPGDSATVIARDDTLGRASDMTPMVAIRINAVSQQLVFTRSSP